MFKRKGYRVFENSERIQYLHPDLVCFTGGEDVTPALYNEKALSVTHSNYNRDNQEQISYEQYKDINKVGICRGGQFLNVMNGGKMWQHVEGHATGQDHIVHDLVYGQEVLCTSTHHQMMIPAVTGEVEVLGIADKRSDTYISSIARDAPTYDMEVVWYPTSRSLCFQPHPEYSNKDCEAYFFDLVNLLF